MGFSMRRVNALFKKELKDVLKNTNIFIMVLLPLVICFLYSKVFGSVSGKLDGKSSSLFVLDLSVNMNLILVSAFVIAMLIAEEKEKNTLRTLMLSAVTPLEFFAGKALLTLFMTIVTNTIMFFILSIELRHLPLFLGATTLCSFCMIAFGALIGILAKNQMATGALGMPLYFGFLLLSLIHI